MQAIAAVVQGLLHAGTFTYDGLAHDLGVSAATVARWCKGESQPRPPLERRIREIAGLVYSPYERSVIKALDSTLARLRELLHSHGRYGSRNEALDEVSKLLFAHIALKGSGGAGISRSSLNGSGSPAMTLRRLVNETISAHMPKSLSHGVLLEDFQLHIKPSEDHLAAELIACFDALTAAAPDLSLRHVSHLDLINEVFGKFLAGSFVDEKELGQYLTPSEVARFMVQVAIAGMTEAETRLLLDPNSCSEFGTVLDPSCGVGSFLAETLRALQGRVVESHGHAHALRWLDQMVRHVIVGVDKSERMVRLALTNLAMFGVPAANLHLANALMRSGPDGELTKRYEGQAGLILSNPPFGAEFASADTGHYRIATTWSHKVPAKIDSELLFIERYIDWLRPDGQCVVIVPDSVLTNRGLFENLRRGLARRIAIQGVFSLPSVTFGAAGTSTKTSVLHFRKRKAEDNDKRRSFVAMCHNVGYTVATRGSQRYKVGNGDGDLPMLLDDFMTGRSRPSISRWVPDLEEAHRWDAVYHASLPEGFQERISDAAGSELLVKDVANLVGERADPRRWGNRVFRYIEISDVDLETCMLRDSTIPCAEAPSRARKLVRAGDVLVSTVRPERKAVGVVRADQDGCICTTGFAVLRGHSADPLTLAYLLKTDFVTAQLLRNMAGIAYPVIDEECLPHIVLPIQREMLPMLTRFADDAVRKEEESNVARKAHVAHLTTAVSTWLAQVTSKEGATPHRESQTIYHPPSRT